MLANAKLVATTYIAILALNVHAQTSSAAPPASTPACVTACINSSLSPEGCVSATDLQCLCTNSEFDQTSIQCIRANCTAAERTQAIQLQQDECTAFNGTSETSATVTSAVASPTKSSSSAMIGKVQFGAGGLIEALASLVVASQMLF